MNLFLGKSIRVKISSLVKCEAYDKTYNNLVMNSLISWVIISFVKKFTRYYLNGSSDAGCRALVI